MPYSLSNVRNSSSPLGCFVVSVDSFPIHDYKVYKVLSHSYCKLYPFFSLSTAFVQNIKVRKSLRHRLYFLLDYSSSYVSQLFKELEGLSKFRIKSIATSLHLSRILLSAMFSHFHTDHPLSEVVISADLTILRGKISTK